MIKINILITAILLLLVSCEKQTEQATILVDIKNNKSAAAKVRLTPLGKKFSFSYKTVALQNGMFTLDTLIKEPHEVSIQPDEMLKTLPDGGLFAVPSKIIKFFIYPNSTVKISAVMSDYKVEYTANGNILNEQYTAYRSTILDDYASRYELSYKVKSLYATKAQDSVIKIAEAKERVAYRKMKKAPLNFVKNNYNLELSPFLLINEPKNVIIAQYNNLSQQVKASDYGVLLKTKIDLWAKASVNAVAPDFVYETYKGNTFRLSENLQKYVVLDFWGSWCVPCMSEMPKLKTFYKNNKDKIELIGVGSRDIKERWSAAIQDNDLTWTHILNNKNGDDLVEKYAVNAFPTKIVISPKGIIEGVFVGAKDDFFITMRTLLSE